LFRLQRLSETLAQRAELCKLELRKLGIPLSEVRNRRVEPLLLMLLLGAYNAAPHDVLK